MAYIGSTPTTQSFISGTDYFNGTGSATAFTMSRSVASVNDIQAVVNNVVQVPNDAYTISGTTITFTSAPSSGTSNVYVRYLSTTTQAITPSQGTVSYNTFDSNMQSAISTGMKNRIINGAMVIDQRNAGAAVTTSGAYPLDRFYVSNGVGTSTFSSQQSSTAPAGFTKSLYYTVTAADATLDAADRAYIVQSIEGYNTADLGWGTASAKTVTLSFWVRSSLTGTFGGSLRNEDANRSYPFTYTISSANTWTQASVTIAGDTSGTWVTTNGIGIQLVFGLGLGSNWTTTANAWAAGNYLGPTGAVSLTQTTNANIYITGVQLEVGSSATGFEYRQYGQELALCQRYYEKSFNTSVAPAQNVGSNLYEIACTAVLAGTGQARFPVKFLVTKRTSPTTTTTYNPSAANAQARDLNATADCTSTSVIYASDNSMLIQGTQPAGTAAGNRIAVNWSAEAEL
jgi:hypothetical protein